MAIATHGYLDKDPLISFCLEKVLHFLEVWHASPSHMSMGIQAVWPKMIEDLEGPYRWAKVKGPMSSAVATLLDWQFRPVSFNFWIDPDGLSWLLDPKDPNFVGAAKEVLRHHFHKAAWAAVTPDGATPGAPELQP